MIGKRSLTWLLLLLALACRYAPPAAVPASVQELPAGPETVFEGLFQPVQLDTLFADSKTFADCRPVAPSAEVMEAYEAQKDEPDFVLEDFVAEYFEMPRVYATGFVADTAREVEAHIEALWPVLRREPDDTTLTGSLIPLPNPYIVPGGRFREIYYWDSYFTMLGLQVSDTAADMIRPMIDNFAYLLQTYGFIPNGNRTYFLSRSQPPFFAAMVNLLASREGPQVYPTYLEALETEYDFWMDGQAALGPDVPAYRRVVQLDRGTVLNRYYDDWPRPRPESYREDVELAAQAGRDEKQLYRDLRAACESGWDFSGRWCRDPLDLATIHTTEILPVDLNSLLYHLEVTLAEAYEQSEQDEKSRRWGQKAEARRAAVQQYCWNDSAGAYFDYDFVAGQQVPFLSAATVYPLYFGLANAAQAEQVAATVEAHLLFPGGLITTPVQTGQQWDAPNGWAPLNWLAIDGLRRYGHKELAESIKTRWVALNTGVYERTGRMVEKYDVTDLQLEAGGGEYPLQDGFGWSNGVLLRLLRE